MAWARFGCEAFGKKRRWTRRPAVGGERVVRIRGKIVAGGDFPHAALGTTTIPPMPPRLHARSTPLQQTAQFYRK
jgi:hypothetical protein